MASAPETAPSTKSSAPPPPPAGVGTAPPPIGSNSTAPPPPGSSPPPPPLVTSPPPPSPPPPSPTPSTPPPPPPAPENSSVQPPTPPPPSSPPPPTTNSPPPTPLPSGPPSSSSPPSTQSPPSPPSPATKPSPSVPSNSAKNSTSPPKGVPNVPPSRASPFPKDDSSKVQSSDGQSEADLPLVIGVSLGVGVFMALMIVALVLCARSRKKKKPFYYDHAAAGTEGGFYPGGPHPKWQNGPAIGGQHIGKIPPPPGGPNGGAWAYPQMPPAPAMMYSGEMSSGGFSNPHGTPVLPPPSPGVALGFNKGTFTYDELAAATNGFSQANLLGQGGFGYVFKGVLPNGKEVAVKQLKADSGQGEREFHAEVEIISRVHHRHLVSLVGYCITGQHRLLVYEFVPNKTLEYHLYGKGLPTMDWPTRLKIALGSAKGLSYLHEDCHPRIIHRDIKAANILIDYKFEAMVADFGLAKLSEDTNTHVSTRIMGTFGYLAPEYASTGKLTEKSDVFSFGVMLLELITGRRPIDRAHMEEDSLVDWARPLLTQALSDDNFEGIVDPRLENNYNTMEMARMIACAAASVRHSARRRPKMSQIVRALEGDVLLDDLNEGVKPGQSVFFSSSGSDGDYASYNTRMKQFRRAALGTSDDFSKGYSGVTSEYGLNPSESSSSGEMSTTGSTRGNTGTRV